MPQSRIESGHFTLDAQGNFQDVDLGNGATATDQSEFFSKIVNVEFIDTLGVMLDTKGAVGGSSGDVTFKFQTAVKGADRSSTTIWESDANTYDITVALNGTTREKILHKLDVSFCTAIRLLSITNGDAGNNANNCMAHYTGEVKPQS